MADVVLAALVITKKANGSDLYLYQGTVLPDEVPDSERKRLAAEGLIGSDAKPKPAASK